MAKGNELAKTEGMLTIQDPKVQEAVEMALVAWPSLVADKVDKDAIAMAIIHCFVRGVNPFGGECYLIPYWDKKKERHTVSVQMSIHALGARAMMNPKLHHLGAPYIWVTVIMKGKDRQPDRSELRKRPIHGVGKDPIIGAEVTAYFVNGLKETYYIPWDMYKGKERGWQDNHMNVAFMFAKCVVVYAYRCVSPKECGGFYIDGEIVDVEHTVRATYDTSILHRERIVELADVGLTVSEANAMLGFCTNHEQHIQELNKLLIARENAQAAESAKETPVEPPKQLTAYEDALPKHELEGASGTSPAPGLRPDEPWLGEDGKPLDLGPPDDTVRLVDETGKEL